MPRNCWRVVAALISIYPRWKATWKRGGNGAAAINNLMEDAATVEISRSQIWQWIRHGAKLADGRAVTRDLYRQISDEELHKLGGPGAERYEESAELLDKLILTDQFIDFLTLIAYDYLD
jgi:malate synthase